MNNLIKDFSVGKGIFRALENINLEIKQGEQDL